MSRTVGGVRSLLYPKPETLYGWWFDGLGEGVRSLTQKERSPKSSRGNRQD